MKKVFIYCLKDADGNIRYVGKTTNIKRRLSGHISDAKRNKGRRHVLNWIYSELQKGGKPTIGILEICNESNWEGRECFWIEYYRQSISNLCNNANGGMGGSGNKNYTESEIYQRKVNMSKLMSKFSDNDKRDIWRLIQKEFEFERIKEKYPEFSRQMYFGVKNGRQWNLTTGLPKTKGKTKRRGYTLQKGKYYVVRDKTNRHVIFSSKKEDDVIRFLGNGQEDSFNL